MNRPGSVGLVLLVVVVTVAGVGGSLAVAGVTAGTHDTTTTIASGPSVESTSTVEPSPSLQSQEYERSEFDTTTFEVTVHENGTATWTFRYEKQLEDDEVGDFENFAEEFESEELELYTTFRYMADNMTRTGAEETGREMDARDFDRSAHVEQMGLDQTATTGVVEMSFAWDGFAAVEEGTVTVGDVFNGFYIFADQRIVIQAGGDLVIESVAPDDAEYTASDLENADEVVWEGDREFLDGHPRVVFDDPAVSGSGSDGPFSTMTGASSDALWPLLVVAIAVGIGGAVVWYRRTDRDGQSDAGTDAPADTAPAESAPERSSAGADDPGGADEGGLADEELLTDEDRVVKLIRENGGRMKQVNIVEETGWSKSKVSMLLSDMEEEGTISKLRVGRENIISLEGFEPEATKSPFEE